MADTVVVPPATPKETAPAVPTDAFVATPNGGVQYDPRKVTETPKPASDRPQWLPEKFKSPEDFAKSYAELESKLGAQKSPPDPEKPADTPPVVEAPDAAKAVADAGLDMAKLSQEVAESGALSEDSIKALEAKGITRGQIEAHVTGLKAQAELQVRTLAETVGGTEQLQAVLQWAGKSLPKEQAEAFNAALDTNNMALASLLMEGIAAKYVAQNGSEPKLLAAQPSQTAGVQPFGDRAEITKAMSDPRYSTSPAYRAQVEQRMALTDLFKIGM